MSEIEQIPGMRKCPYCAEEIRDEAIICKHCGKDLRVSVMPPKALESKNMETTWVSNLTVVLLVIIMGLNLANLALTYWMGGRSGNIQGETTTAKQLPSALTDVERDRLFQRIQRHYNAEDTDAIYELIDPYIQVELDHEQTVQMLEGIITMFGQIEEGVYSHYEYIGSSEGRDWFNLFYKVMLEGSAFNSGVMKISIFDDGEHYGIAGLYLNSE